MVKSYGPKRRRRFDEEADWLPPKNRPFVMKRQQRDETEPEPPLAPKTIKKTSDAEGLSQAAKTDNGFYLDPAGTLHMAGTRGSFLGPDWMENYRVYGPGLAGKLKDMYGMLEGGNWEWKDWYSTDNPFNMEDTNTYKALDQYMNDNPGEVKNFVAHSKGSSVVETWMENHLEFTGHARLYATPHIDVIGSEKCKDFLNQTRQDRHEYYTSDKFLGPSWLAKAGE